MTTTDIAARERLTPKAYLLQVIAEVRKIVWPTRRELTKYTAVVLVFVLVMAGYVAAVDFGLTELMLSVFG